jgi:GntR family transcriptional regulator/MocR family aminotransferase
MNVCRYKYAEVADRIRAKVESGELRPGSRLLASKKLAVVMDCHHHTVLKAFRVLEQEGYVETTAGSGTFVTKPRRFPVEG